MSSSELVRWGALGAMLAGVAWVVSGLISLVVPGQGTEDIGSFSYYLLETIFYIACFKTDQTKARVIRGGRLLRARVLESRDLGSLVKA